MDGNATRNDTMYALRGKIVSIPKVDTTLTKEGCAADAKATGEAIQKVSGAIPAKTSELTNDSDFQTGEQVRAEIGKMTHYTFEKVNSLEEATNENVIYLVPNEITDTDNIYDEYLLVDGVPELIGSTAIDLSGYVLEENLPKTLPNPKKLIFTGAVTAEYDGSEEQTINIPESSGGGMTEEQISLLNGKIDSPQTAEVGQVLSVKAVDENGKPIEWRAADVHLLESVDSVILLSSTADSTKLFKLTVDDTGTITATEITE